MNNSITTSIPSLSYDLVCLSHLRWDFVTQRPQHLLNRCARDHRVLFVEEPVHDVADVGSAFLDATDRPGGVQVLVPHLPSDLTMEQSDQVQEALLLPYLEQNGVNEYVLWVYTPMALGFAENLNPIATVYDCMDELSAFAGASPLLRQREAALFQQADLVFTGGQSLYEVKRTQHPHVFAFPSSVDTAFFAKAREQQTEPEDQAAIPHPRLGFYGVVDERFDIELLRGVAELRPDWHWVILGPVVKIDPAHLPQGSNIHFLGGKKYEQLPGYIAGWDVALLLFAHNESTRFISPTKTPEYLAAGKPVVSTSIRDVVRPYGDQGLAHIADTPEDFIAACEATLSEDPEARQKRADAFLSGLSWDKTWAQMAQLIDEVVAENRKNRAASKI
jgi:UDP-galactopyranose mutase